MKQKINVRLILIAFLATIVTTISVTVVHYRLFQEQVKHDLRPYYLDWKRRGGSV